MKFKTSNRPTFSMCLIGWLRFLAFFICLLAVTNAVAQVFKHWAPGDQNVVSYALRCFSGYLASRLAVGFMIGAIVLLFAVRMRLPPPRWMLPSNHDNQEPFSQFD